MDIQQKQNGGPPVPPRVKRVLEPGQPGVSRKMIMEMDERDLAAIKKVVRREVSLPEDWQIGRAMYVLVVKEPTAETAAILAKIAGDEAEVKNHRLSAAALLAQVAPEPAEGELIKHANTEDLWVRNQVIKSLGCVGGPAALDALDTIQGDLPTFVARQLAFSKALISYRHNIKGNDLPFVEGVVREPGSAGEMIHLTLERMGAKSIEPQLPRFTGSSYGIGLSDRLGFRLRAGKALWVLFVNQQLENEGLFTGLLQRKHLIGLLSLHEARTGTFAPQYVVLSHPRDKGIEIFVVRTDGELFYSGRAGLVGKSLRFQIADIDRRGTAPTNVKGALTRQGIRLDLVIPFGKRVNKRTPIVENF